MIGTDYEAQAWVDHSIVLSVRRVFNILTF